MRKRRSARAGLQSGWRWGRWAGVVLLLAACQSSSSGAPLPPGPPVVTVTLREYAFEYNPVVPSGRVVFRFVNSGQIPHQPDLIPLLDTLPPIDQEVRDDVPTPIAPFAGIRSRQPGQVGTFAVDLVPGQRYAFVCFARDTDDNESHALQGMTTEFRPTEPGPAPEPGP